jgi:drug/metabolite transporter (DMT)-like permease
MVKLGFKEIFASILKNQNDSFRTRNAGVNSDRIQTAIFTGLALIAFASNSVICRLALANASIDPAGFSAIRLISGAIVLAMIADKFKDERTPSHSGNWISAGALFLYAITFSFAYVSLSACTGSLILFGAVQVTMIIAGLARGERPGLLEWTGLIVALSGLIYLMMPGWESPSVGGAALMMIAGVSWGIYSLRGHNVGNPIAVTSDNFTRTIPFTLLVSLVLITQVQTTLRGTLLAFVSGALTSGIGYVIWYAALSGLTVTRAATVQLLVPVIAAIGGVIFLSEYISLRLILSAVMILGGVGSSFFARSRVRD